MKKNLLCLFLLFCFSTAFTQTVYHDFIDGRVYVKFNPAILKPVAAEDPRNVSLSKLKAIGELIGKYGITKAYKPFYQASDDENLPYVVKLEFNNSQQVNSLIADLEKIQGVEYAEKVSINRTQAVPNDPLFATAGGSVHLNQINAQGAWNVFNGNSNITVAIVDNAVMWTHADLVTNTFTNTAEIAGNSIDDDGNGYVDDRNGWDVSDNDNDPIHPNTAMFHGTHCAGIAGASTNNSIGVAGMGWNIKIIPVKCEPNSSSNPSMVTYGYEGIIYSVKAKARIISCSWGNNVGSSITEQYVLDYAWNRGSLVICSAGNFGTSAPYYPGAYNHSYCVAAVDATDAKASYSNYGTWIDISAPGSNIESTMPYSSTTPAYSQQSGTSMAAPLVAGLAALMLSKSPYMTNTNVMNCISTTAVNVYTLLANSSYASGSQLGAGRIDAYAAMLCAAGYSAVPPIANFYAFPPKTCPNTSIKFYDSSLYLPTSWSWVFQGGSPPTSTVVSPIVSWPGPGTYSVSLTVSNANGFNSITKFSYVTVSGPSPLPFFEGFENSQFLPAGWYPNNIWNDNIYWTRRAGLGAFGTSTACAMFDNFTLNAPGERDEMRSPTFDFSNVVSARLRFDVAYAQYDPTFSDTLEVTLSANCGTNWTNVYLKGGSLLSTAPNTSNQFTPTTIQWRRDSVDISVAAGGHNAVMFGFINRGHYGQPIYLDNINLVFPTPTLSTLGASSICVNSPLTFTNTSTSSFSYSWNFPGGSPAASTATNPTVSYTAAGVYTVTLFGVNGTSTASTTRTIYVSSFPNLSIASNPSGSICSGTSVTLTVTGANTYSLNGNNTGSVSVINPTATSVYTIIGSNSGCNTVQTVSITVKALPISTLSVINASCANLCNGVVVANTSGTGPFTYSLNTGACPLLPCSNLCAGSYTFFTFDAVGCQSSKTFSINAPLPINVAMNYTQATCSSCTNGALQVSPSGGVAPFTYTWIPTGGNSVLATGLAPQCYTINITDANGCAFSDTACVGFPNGIKELANGLNVKIYPNPAHDNLTIEASTNFNYAVFDNLGQLICNGKAEQNKTDIRLEGFALGIYFVEVETPEIKLHQKVIIE